VENEINMCGFEMFVEFRERRERWRGLTEFAGVDLVWGNVVELRHC
jgi:hypothetical protein